MGFCTGLHFHYFFSQICIIILPWRKKEYGTGWHWDRTDACGTGLALSGMSLVLDLILCECHNFPVHSTSHCHCTGGALVPFHCNKLKPRGKPKPNSFCWHSVFSFLNKVLYLSRNSPGILQSRRYYNKDQKCLFLSCICHFPITSSSAAC